MRIHVVHETVYTYDPPASGVIQVLRVTPRNHDGQYVLRWRVETSEDCRFDQAEDAFGNITQTLSAAGPLGRLSIAVDGEVETQSTNGIVRGTVEQACAREGRRAATELGPDNPLESCDLPVPLDEPGRGGQPRRPGGLAPGFPPTAFTADKRARPPAPQGLRPPDANDE